MGRVKIFASLENLKLILHNEGFLDITIQYLGELWVLMKFDSKETLEKFHECASIDGWFSDIKAATLDFQPIKRIAWVEVEGIPLKLWSEKTFKQVAKKWGDLLDVDDKEDSCFHSKRLCIHTRLDTTISEDFKIVHRGITYWVRAKETPGWVPDFSNELTEEDLEENNNNMEDLRDKNSELFGDDSDEERIPETMAEEDVKNDKNVEEKIPRQAGEYSEDIFNLFPLINKVEKTNVKDTETESVLKYPPGFSSKEIHDENSLNDCGVDQHRKCFSGKEDKAENFGNQTHNANRQILDGPFILNETIQWCKAKNNQALIFKVDFEKAYDSVRWDFLDEVLMKFDFGDKWRNWIKSCLYSSRGSIIVNGSPTNEFTFGRGLKQGLKVGDGSVHLSHMFFADDVIFVGKWSDNNINTLIHVLKCFHKVSGLRINMSKSKIMGVNVECNMVSRAANKFGCLILNTPFKYFGSIVGGRLTLVKSVLGSIPLYQFSLFKAPAGVLKSIESMRSRFFSGHGSNSKKASWINWKKALASKEREGLGISSLYALNRGLLFKWIWRFVTQKNSLWARVIQAVHGLDGKIGPNMRWGYNSTWTSIVQEFHTGLLKDLFPRVYALEQSKHITVANKVSSTCLSFSFRRCPRGGREREQFERLIDVTKDVLINDDKDRWEWALDKNKEFLVSSIRNLIDQNILPGMELQTKWCKSVPIKINVHTWRLMTNALPTRFNLSRRGISLDSIIYPNCEKGVETVSHLFFSCPTARKVVMLINRWWHIPDEEMDSFEEWNLWFVNVRMQAKNKKLLQGVFYVTVFVDGDWNTDPDVVKDVFKDHFATRFKQPAHGRLKLNISFLNRLSTDQVADMDRSVSRDEICVAVWN
nr:RNA-directed DNA polymerase, eukaryota, reverse transcriptase zinc-binding domain protein [Tanacetum cinerariifolium]